MIQERKKVDGIMISGWKYQANGLWVRFMCFYDIYDFLLVMIVRKVKSKIPDSSIYRLSSLFDLSSLQSLLVTKSNVLWKKMLTKNDMTWFMGLINPPTLPIVSNTY